MILIVAAMAFRREAADVVSIVFYMQFATAALAAISLASVFAYKNRRRQRHIVGWTRALCAITLLAVAVHWYLSGLYRIAGSDKASDLVVATVALVVTIALLRVAELAIKKDIALIVSMDRIR